MGFKFKQQFLGESEDNCILIKNTGENETSKEGEWVYYKSFTVSYSKWERAYFMMIVSHNLSPKLGQAGLVMVSSSYTSWPSATYISLKLYLIVDVVIGLLISCFKN